LVFEWDAKKAANNKTEHGVSFEEAGTAFFDSAALDGEDIDHSTTEARRFRLAQSAAGIFSSLRTRSGATFIKKVSSSSVRVWQT